ncbi:hypothetical protein ACIOML_12850 [Streptomyces anulatus]
MGHGEALADFGSGSLAMTAAPRHALSPIVRLFVSFLLTASQVGRVHWT